MDARCLFLLTPLLIYPSALAAKERVLDPKLHHLRQAGPREWDDFPEKAEGPNHSVRFQAEANPAVQTLRWRQQDVKQTWKLLLNGKELGRLRIDENDTVLYLPLPPGALKSGANEIRIEPTGKTPDDIRVGELILDDRLPETVLSEAHVEIRVTDADHPDAALPCRLTILNEAGALMSVGAKSGGPLAVRPGVVYSGTGKASFGLPAGKYTVVAGRGFAYGIDSTSLTLEPGQTVRRKLTLRREVPTPGYVSCDTHVHTFTHSGHGDATLDERMLTLAGENIELPIATDHNVHIDYRAAAERAGVRPYFTPVVGNEVTTGVGHFCVFPVTADAAPPDFKAKDWKSIFDRIDRAGAKVVVLNHARDLHSGYRPFGPKHHNAVTGENLDGWELRANAMEVINSGAMQTDDMRLYRDWFGLLNRGIFLTPVGASDSHDVNRYIVGQGRTYVRAKSDNPGQIAVDDAVANFRAGRVLVSLGLLADITVNGKYGPGDLALAIDGVHVRVRVLGPAWTTAEKVELFANGKKIRAATIADGKKGGLKWEGSWDLPRFTHDVHLAAIATGPGITQLYWPIGKPYQPTSPRVNRRVIGSTGAVWIDADGDGKRTSAYDYAQRLMKEKGDDMPTLVAALGAYDEAVAAQVAGLLQARGTAVSEAPVRAAAKKAGTHVQRGFEEFFNAWRESQIARQEK